jgi:hypothetical protein
LLINPEFSKDSEILKPRLYRQYKQAAFVMKNLISIIALIWCISLCPLTVSSQVNCADGSVNTGETYSGQVFFNYGAVNNAFSTKNRTTLTIGEPLAGVFAGQQYNGMMGFYGRFLLPPLPPTVVASQGELLDRIQVTWITDPLSPDASGGFNVYRDNIFLSSVGKNVRSYNDFNVIAGRPYVYRISGINEFGEGTGGEAIGFQTPNGVVTGKVETISRQPVADAVVTLTPLQGFSAAFGNDDGAFYHLDTSATDMLPGSGGSWTIAFWIKTNLASNNGGVIRLGESDLYFRALNSSSGQDGVEVSTTATGASFLSANFPDSTRNGWHHIALSYSSNGGQGRLYLDGALVAVNTMSALGVVTDLHIGGLTEQGDWAGKLDELRLYHTLLEEADLSEIIMSTASSLTPGLAYYWKFDEEQGEGSFDIIDRQKINFCGAEFSSDRPNVKTAARTNENGYYRIEGVSYGTGTTFLATPSKDFYANRSLRFHRAESDYVSLPDFSLTPKATLELWVNSSGPDGTQTVLEKKWGSNEFRINLVPNGNDNEVVCYLNGNQYNFGTLGVGYQLLSLTIDSSGTNRTVSLYKNGTLSATHTFTGVTDNWSDAAQPWILGGRFNGSTLTDAYGGFIDEFAVYDTTLSQATIQSHHENTRQITENGLRVYFSLNEGGGMSVNSTGSLLLEKGTVHGAVWSSFTAMQETTPHEFSPVTRQVTLNPSVTSVDLVDFFDKSTIPVTGYVRYKNTDCFASNVEITNDGLSFTPKVLTDSTGKFTIDADPGQSFRLVPKYEDHLFTPAFFEVTNVSTPVAGILFSDITTRNIEVSVVGGSCKISTLGDNLGTDYGSLVLQIRNAQNDCFERYGTMTSGTTYTFTEVPPFEQVSVGLFSHENNDIKNAIQALGAITVDITKKDTALEFLYLTPDPEVEIFEGLANDCPELKYWDPSLPVGSVADFTANKVRLWEPPLPLGASVNYTTLKVLYNNVEYSIVNNSVTFNSTDYDYSEYPINTTNETVTIGSDLYSLVPSDASTVLEKGDDVTIKVRVQEQYPGGTCVLNEADLRFVNGFADEVKDTSLVAALYTRSGTVTGGNSMPLANKPIRVRATLQPSSTSAPADAYYREVHAVTTNSSGVFSVRIGAGTRDTAVGGTFDQVPWYPSSEAPFLKIEVDTMLNGSYTQNGAVNRTAHPQTSLTYKFTVGDANPVSPYYKTMQVIGTTPDGRKGSTSKIAVISGTRLNGERFTTSSPQRPLMILRDPPGDASYSYISKDSTICDITSFAATDNYDSSIALDFDGSPENLTLAGIGVATGGNFESGVDFGFGFNYTRTKVAQNEIQTCMTFNQTISTSDADIIVGGDHGGDVYIGVAENMVFGTSDRIQVNNCVIMADQVISIRPGGATGFRYSEYYIKRYLIPYLDLLATEYNLMGKADSAALMTESRDSWEMWIKLNNDLKQEATLKENLSFDAGVVYESAFSSSGDSLALEEFTNSYSASGYFTVKFGVLSAGTSFTGSTEFTFDRVKSSGNTYSNTRTVGYSLSDDDPGDAFSVDILDDPVFNGPVFKVKSGQSSCPHEPGTASRDRPSIQPVAGYPLQAINIPSKEAAIFRFNLGNNSQSYETRHYNITATGEDNPDGAVIKLNGGVLNLDMDYEVLSNSSVPITITVERGPVEYEYNDLLLEFTSGCEVARADALGLDPAQSPLDSSTTINELAYSSQKISVNFVRPCSEVDIDYPRNNYVILSEDPALTPVNSTVRDIIVNNYSLIDPGFQAIRVQYRRADGNGIWTNILAPSNFTASNPHERWNTKNNAYLTWTGSPKPDTLGPISTTFKWETAGLEDGNYELRAISVCTGAAAGMEGTSYYIPIRIDREPPSLLGTPEPADGVFSNGDEISCSFNKLINCNLIQADQMNPNNVGLYDAVTDALIDATISCYENKLIIVPNVDNRFIENKILRVELHDIEDKTGNKRDFLSWEFKVDRNELAWLTDSVGLTFDVHDSKTMTASIINRSGSTVPFKIVNSLPWIRVVPDTGIMVANEIKPIRFIVDSTLAIGSWSGVDTLKTIHVGSYIQGGDEPLKIGVRVLCDQPRWDLNAGLYENTMNLVLKLNIQGEISIDPEDMVAAYIGDELRGRCNVEFVPQLNTYLAYLTIYGTSSDLQAPIELLVWDAQDCLIYASVQETFHFVPDQVIGTPTSPQIIHTNSNILRRIPLGIGWNWISFNLKFPDNNINTALAYLLHPEDGLIKSQSAFSSYVTGTGWAGSLTTVNNKSMYNYKSDVRDTLKMIGNLISPDTLPIPVVQGWNWIGYVPNYSLPVNDALESLPAAVGDIIKSQEAFAQYIGAPHGWIGNLKFMQAPKGYQIKVTNPGTLTYPENSQFKGGEPADRGENPVQASFWTVNPSQYEYGSTFIGMLSVDGVNGTTASLELGAFHGSEVRGSAQAVFIPSMNSYLFFMTMYSNVSGQPISFKLYNAGTGEISSLSESIIFTPDQHQGTVASPVPFTLTSTGTSEGSLSVKSFSAVPNPFHSETYLQFVTGKRESAEILITDVCGNLVTRIEVNTVSGLNTVQWNTTGGNPAGVYLAQLKTESGVLSCKLILQ